VGLLPGVGLVETPKISTVQSREAESREAASTLEADAKREMLLINFTGALDAAAVAGATYQLTINGETVEVESAALVGGSTVSLLLPEGAMRSGDRVAITCLRLRDEGGALVKPVPLTTVAR
jgi:D-aminopeptidase